MQRAGLDLAKNTLEDKRWFLDRNILPRIGELRIDEITGAEIVQLSEQIAAASSPTMARKGFAVVSVLFGHAQARHLAKTNPCAGLKLKAILGKKQPVRKTVALTEGQLRELLQKLPAIGAQNGLAVRILLSTCTRKGELIHSRWEHVDLEQGLWAIPAENSKNGKPFDIPARSERLRNA